MEGNDPPIQHIVTNVQSLTYINKKLLTEFAMNSNYSFLSKSRISPIVVKIFENSLHKDGISNKDLE